MILQTAFSSIFAVFPQIISAQNDGFSLNTLALLMLAAFLLFIIIGIISPIFFIVAGVFAIAAIVVAIFIADNKKEVERAKKENTQPRKIHWAALLSGILAGIGLAIGIISIFTWWFPLILSPVILAVAAALALVGLAKIKKNPEKYRGKKLALFALISLGFILLLLALHYIFFHFFVVID